MVHPPSTLIVMPLNSGILHALLVSILAIIQIDVQGQVDSTKWQLDQLLLQNTVIRSHLDTVVRDYHYVYADTSQTPLYQLSRDHFPQLRFDYASIDEEPYASFPIASELKDQKGWLVTPLFDMAADDLYVLNTYWINLADSTVWTLKLVPSGDVYMGLIPAALDQQITQLK